MLGLRRSMARPLFWVGCVLLAPIVCNAVYAEDEQEVVPLEPDVTALTGDKAQTVPSTALVTLGRPIRRIADAGEGHRDLRAATMRAIPRRPFQPTISDEEYAALKAEAARSRLRGPSAALRMAPQAVRRAATTPPVLQGVTIEGAEANPEVGAFPTADPHGAIGHTHFVAVNSGGIDMWATQDSTVTKVKTLSLADFFGYAVTELLEPRVLYDPIWRRWVVTATALPESPTVQRHLVAISRSSDPTRDYYIYTIDVDFFDQSDFWDYAQLGMDQDALIITANRFSFDGFKGSDVITLSKARVYNGMRPTFKLFTVPTPSVAPSIAKDQNPKSFLIGAPPAGATLQLYALTDTSRAEAVSLTGPTAVAVPDYILPPQAAQPGTFAVLDTLDARFVNAGAQVGDKLWQVHTINRDGRPAPRYYAIDTDTAEVVQSGFIAASATSHDFNASLAANGRNEVFVTWNSTDPEAGTPVQIRFSGKRFADASIPAGSAAFTSATVYENADEETGVAWWGQYSAVTIDPRNNTRAWIVNEKVNSPFIWGTGIARIGFE